MKNSGVTSPPLKPAPSVTTVNRSLIAQLHGCVSGPKKLAMVRLSGLAANTQAQIVARAEQKDERDNEDPADHWT